MQRPALLVLAALALLPAPATATTISLGVFAFDNLIPAGAGPGINVFDISNFTGATYNLAPDFPVLTELTLDSVTLDLDGSAGTQQIDLGDIAPGLYTPAAADEFTTTETFTSATLTATLSASSLLLFNSTTFTPNSTTITATILPSSGTKLTPGTDFALITATHTALATPEPNTALTLIPALLLLMCWCRRRINTFSATTCTRSLWGSLASCGPVGNRSSRACSAASPEHPPFRSAPLKNKG